MMQIDKIQSQKNNVIKKNSERIISILLLFILFFNSSVCVMATELKEAKKQYQEQMEIRKLEELKVKEQAELYENYFGKKEAVTLSGNEAIFSKGTKSGEDKKTLEYEIKGNVVDQTQAERTPILTEEYNLDAPIHVGRFEKTYQTSKNQYQTVFTSYPNTFYDNGVEKVIDNTLVKEDKKPRSISQNEIDNTIGYTNKEGYFDTSIRGSEKQFQMEICTDNMDILLHSGEGDYSKESVSQNAIRYNDVYHNVDIQYTITNAGVKEDIILLTNDSRDTFCYTLKKDGIRLTMEDNTIYVYEVDKNDAVSNNSLSSNTLPPVAMISAPKMEDALGVISRDIEMNLTEEGDFYAITIEPNKQWLNAPERVYPVLVDPTITIQAQIDDFTVTRAGGFWSGQSTNYIGYHDLYQTSRYYLITSYLYQGIKELADSNNVEILDATLRLYQTNDATGSTIGCYRNKDQLPEMYLNFDDVVGIDRIIAGENSTSQAGYGEHTFDITDSVSGWMNGIYPSHGLVFILDNENKAAVEIAGIGAENVAERPCLTINWQVAGDVASSYSLDDTTINLRPLVKSDISGAMQCYGVFADGLAKPRAVLTYDLSDSSKMYGKSILIFNEKIYPNSSTFDSVFPNGTLQYVQNESNWQTIVPFTDFAYDTMYHMFAKAEMNEAIGKTANSDNFIIYRVSRYDTMKKIADYYGVPLAQLLFDNKAPDMLLVENNTLFIRNPTKNQNTPYQPQELTDAEKAQIDRALLGRARHCEYGFEPINLNTGNYYLSQDDVNYSDCFGEFRIVRSYNSLLSSKRGSFGCGFTSLVDENIAKNSQGDIYYNREDGSTVVFSKQIGESYIAPAGCNIKLNSKKIGDRVVTISAGDTTIPIYVYQITREDGSIVTFDENGVMVEVAEKNGATMQILHDSVSGNVCGIMREGAYFSIETNDSGCITKIICPDLSYITYEYDEKSNLIKVKNPMGYEKRFTYDANHFMTAWYDENNNPIIRNTYDASGRVIRQLDEGGVAHTLTYSLGKTIATDGNNNKTEYFYDSLGRTTQILYADGSKETKTYENGYLKSETDADGNITTYSYDGNGNITEKKMGDKVWVYEYDSCGNLIKTVDPLQYVSTGTYNANDQVIKTTDGDGRSEQYSYDSRGRLVAYIDSDGLRTSYTYQNNQLYQKKVGNSLLATYTYNAMGDVLEERDALGHTLQYAYDLEHHCTAKKDKNGVWTLYTYYPNGLLKSVTDGNAHTVTYAYDKYGNTNKIIQPDGGTIGYTYDAEGNLLTQTDAEGNTTTYTYDNRNRKKTITDASGYTVTYEYDKMGNVIQEKDPKGPLFTATYDTIWKLPITTTDALGHETVYKYDAMGNLTQVIYENNLLFTYEYDAQMRRIKETYANGLSYTYVFDARNNLIQKTDTSGLSEKTIYNDFSQPIKEITKGNRITSYTYDIGGNISEKIAPEGHKTFYSCDNNGNVIAVKDANGNRTEYAYDACGNMSSLKKADGTILLYAYDENERLVAYKDGNDAITTYAYDMNGNQIQVIDALNQKTEYSYNELNYLIQVTDALNHKTNMTYDYFGNILKVADGNGADITFTYDRNQNLLAETDENGHTKSYQYDAYGRIIKEIDALGNQTSYQYDEVGNLTQVVNALSEKTNYTYDLFGNCIKTSDAQGKETYYTYNAEDELVQTYDERGVIASYEYNKNGLLIKETNALNNMQSYTYDAVGNLIVQCNALGNETTYSYDSVYNLLKTTQADGTTTRLAYDNENHVICLWDGKNNKTEYEYDALGQLIKITDAKGVETKTSYDALSRVVAEQKGESLYQYTYDTIGNLIKETDPLGETTTYEYDAVGNLITKNTPDQKEWLYAYDANNQLIQYTDGDHSVTVYSYDALERLSEIKKADTLQIKYDYNPQSQVSVVTYGNGQKTQYEYDIFGNRTAVVNADGSRTSYYYDKADRLVKKKYADNAEETYTYDGEGNLLKQTSVTGLVSLYEYDPLNRLIKETQIADGKSHNHFYEYDENGNLIKETNALQQATQYQYDENNRLINVISPLNHQTTYTYTDLDNIDTITDAAGNTYHYTYDKKGRMLSEAVDSHVLKNYTYDPMDRITCLESGDSQVLYHYSATRMMDCERNGEKEKYQYDALGELTKQIDSLDNAITYSYDSVGNIIEKTDENEAQTRYSYDALNRLIEIDSKDAQSNASYTYDVMGNIIGMEDITGESHYTYNAEGKLLTYEDGEGRLVTYSYDGFGNLSKLMYPDGSVASYAYDEENRLVSMHANTRDVSYEYDEEGNVIRIIRDNGKTDISYDQLNRIQNLINTCNGKVISAYGYAYDNRSNITKEIVSIFIDGKEHRQENQYKYDALGELIECKSLDDGKEIRVTYSYDVNGNRIGMNTESGAETQSIHYQYDHGREVYEEEKTNGVITRTVQKSYDSAGNLIKEVISKGDGSEEIYVGEDTGCITERYYSYDAKGRLSAIASKDKLLFAALYDGRDNRVFTLEYDEKTKESFAAKKPDEVLSEGKRARKNVKPDSESPSMPEFSEPVNISKTVPDVVADEVTGEEEAHKAHDAFLYGVCMEAVSFLPISTPIKQWIRKNIDLHISFDILREKEVRGDAQEVVFAHTDVKVDEDALKHIVTKETFSYSINEEYKEDDYRKISYVNDINRDHTEVLCETIDGGNVANGSFSYYYGLQRENYYHEGSMLQSGYAAFDIMQVGQSGNYYYDGYGSVSNLIAGEDSLGYVYDAYGNMEKHGMYTDVPYESVSYASPYGYNGEYSHNLIGLQYLRARYYQAETGSFISRDSYAGNIRSILSANRYTYAENNPLKHMDPSGHAVKIKTAISNAVNKVTNAVVNAVVSKVSSPNAKSSSKSTTSSTVNNQSSKHPGETENQYQNRIAQEKAKKSSLKADIISMPLTAYESLQKTCDKALEKCISAIDSTAVGNGFYLWADAACQVDQKVCKGFEKCYNYVQKKIPDKDLSRILNGTGLILCGSGKIAGAVGLAMISMPFIAGGVGVGGEVAAGFTAAAGGGDIAQGLQEIAYGWKGDRESKSYNIVCNLLYEGEYGIYHTSTGTAAMCGGIGYIWDRMTSSNVAKAIVKQNVDDVAEDVAAKEISLGTSAQDAGAGLSEGGKTSNIPNASKRQTPDQSALHKLAKEAEKNAKNGNPISYDEAKILDEWAKEYNVPQHHPAEVGSGQHFPGGNYMDHTHIYNIHVPYKY